MKARSPLSIFAAVGAAGKIRFAGSGEKIDTSSPPADNFNMSIETKDAGSSPTEITSDLQTAIDSMLSHLPLDPETARRVHERAEKVREELRRKGTTNIALDLLRESRDEE